MTLDESIEKLEAAIVKIENGLEEISKEMAISASGLIVRRIQNEGLTGRSYSNNKLPEFFFTGKALNGGGRKLLDKHTKKKERNTAKEKGKNVNKDKALDEPEYGISYLEWRQENGLQVSHIDLTFSGRMWQNIGIIGTVKQGDAWIVIVGGFDKEVKDKLRWNAQRFGNFFMVTDEELEILKETFKRKVLELINSVGL